MDKAAVSEGSSLELEKKYRLTKDEWESVAASLREAGAKFIGEDSEENIIYGGGALEARGGVVRIRTTQDRGLLTFKRRLEGAAEVKRQIEFETEISDTGSTARILNELGLQPKLIYEKRRKTWELSEAEVVLDELPFGLFMEIEGSMVAIKQVEVLLGIEDLTVENDTYPQMTARFGKPAGDRIEARF